MTTPKANKNLGQHFLNNQETIEKISNDFEGKYDAIIEVGPGPATITAPISKKGKPLFIIEKDKRFVEILEKLDYQEIFFEDALEFDLNNQIFSKSEAIKNYWFVSNLPYNVGTPIMLKFLKHPEITYCTLMFQKEVAQKVYLGLYPKKKQLKEMNSLHALVTNFFDVSLLKVVPPEEFSPPPKVDSAVISLVRKNSPRVSLEDWGPYEKFLRVLFQNRRKQMGKNLKGFISREQLTDLGIAPKRRAETLSLDEVYKLYFSYKGETNE